MPLYRVMAYLRSGFLSAWWVVYFTLKWEAELYNPLTYDEAKSLEVELDIDLSEGGFGV